jgi:glycosyltransferase involved in cell wall biosynthesis
VNGTISITSSCCTSGNIKPHKNLVRLIEAFAELRRHGPDELKLADHR